MAYVIAVGSDSVRPLRPIPKFPHDVFAVSRRAEAEAFAKPGDTVFETQDWNGHYGEVFGCAHCVIKNNMACMP